jgi:hypothetical protein
MLAVAAFAPVELARTVTERPGGGARGAVYMPSVEMVPQAFPEVLQVTLQVASTAFPPSVALKLCCPPAGSVICAGLTVSELAFESVTVALALFVVSASETTVTVTAVEGTVDGAV